MLAPMLNDHAVDEIDPFNGISRLVHLVPNEDASISSELREEARPRASPAGEEHHGIEVCHDQLSSAPLLAGGRDKSYGRAAYGLCALKKYVFHVVGLGPAWTFS